MKVTHQGHGNSPKPETINGGNIADIKADELISKFESQGFTEIDFVWNRRGFEFQAIEWNAERTKMIQEKSGQFMLRPNGNISSDTTGV